MGSLVFEFVETILGWRVIPAIPLATHGLIHAMFLQRVLEGLAGYKYCRSAMRKWR
jgi:hypothetical protein